MEIRQATLADVPAIMQLVHRVVPLMRAEGNLQWDDVYPNAKVFAWDIARDQLWLVESFGLAGAAQAPTGSLAGVAAFTTEQEPEYAQAAWDVTVSALVIHRLAVDPAYRGKGVASALMRHAETVAQTKGIACLRVDTNSENLATQQLFPRIGYRFAGEITLRFRPGQRFLCYEKHLTLPAKTQSPRSTQTGG